MCHLGLFVPMKKLCQVGLTKTKWILNLPSLYGVLASETEWLATDSSPKSTSEILVYFWRPQPPGPRSSFASSSRTRRLLGRFFRTRPSATLRRGRLIFRCVVCLRTAPTTRSGLGSSGNNWGRHRWLFVVCSYLACGSWLCRLRSCPGFGRWWRWR